MKTASEAVGSSRFTPSLPIGQKLLKPAVKSKGAVSPAARATDNITPVRIPGRAVGSMTRRTVCARVAPMPIAASRMCAGTMRIASSEVRMIVGSMSSDKAAAPATADLPISTTSTP